MKKKEESKKENYVRTGKREKLEERNNYMKEELEKKGRLGEPVVH